MSYRTPVSTRALFAVESLPAPRLEYDDLAVVSDDDLTEDSEEGSCPLRRAWSPVFQDTARCLDVRGVSHPGFRRPTNEDAWGFELIDDRTALIAVADGMGGLAQGSLASKVAIEELFLSVCSTLTGPHAAEMRRAELLLRRGMERANRALMDISADDGVTMGTTLCAAIVGPGGLTVANVGDSRAYLFREGELTCLTEDHNMAELLRSAGCPPRDPADARRDATILYSSLGRRDEFTLDVFDVSIRAGDTVLLCTDGLHTSMDGETLRGILTESSDPEVTCASLLMQAMIGGAFDNVTGTVLHVRETARRR